MAFDPKDTVQQLMMALITSLTGLTGYALRKAERAERKAKHCPLNFEQRMEKLEADLSSFRRNEAMEDARSEPQLIEIIRQLSEIEAKVNRSLRQNDETHGRLARLEKFRATVQDKFPDDLPAGD